MLVGLSGCGGKKEQKADLKVDKEVIKVRPVTTPEIEIPVADNELHSFFEEELGEFALADEVAKAQEVAGNVVDAIHDEFAWVDQTHDKNFQAVYFEFDKSTITADQQIALERNVALVKDAAEKAKSLGKAITVVLDGHADHSAGSHAYNLALSNQRTQIPAQAVEALGVPVKRVARGDEFPAIVDGKPVEGDRQAQWPNRRVEFRVIYS